MVELDRGARPEVATLVDLTRIPELGEITETDTEIRLGATVTHNQVISSARCRQHAAVLVQACAEIGSPQLRNRATVAGNIVTASPANDTIPALMVLDAVVEIAGSNGRRMVPISEFFTGFRSTVVDATELITSIIIPTNPHRRAVFVKAGLRKAQAISIVDLAVSYQPGAEVPFRCAIGSVAATVVTATGTDIDSLVAAARAVATPIDDVRAPAEYRLTVLDTMIRRAVEALEDNTIPLPQPPLLSPGGVAAAPNPSAEAETFQADSPIDEVQVMVNGYTVRGPAPTLTLLDWLREYAGTKGVKEGCAEGECGACTVELDGAAVMSCLVPAGRADGATVTTVEGLDHDLQAAFVRTGAVQCGFCTPGFLMSGVKLLEEVPNPTQSEIEAGLAGNLCRCTGYNAICAAVMEAAR